MNQANNQNDDPTPTTDDTPPTPPPTFEELGLIPELVAATREAGFEHPTAIQVAAIPAAIEGKDVIGAAQTGSGKTAAFCLPLLQRLAAVEERAASKCPHVLVLSPTRELALQIEACFEMLKGELDLRVASMVGGMGIGSQISKLANGLDIVVATPGRLIDHLERRTLNLKAVRAFVLDEADRMLDMGFEEQLDRIMRVIPDERQTMLFSATIDGAIKRLVRTSVRDPFHADTTDSEAQRPKVDLKWVELMEQDKKDALIKLTEEEEGTMLVFVRTKQRADLFANVLKRHEIDAVALHAGLDQRGRLKALNKFREGKVRIVVATDLAARGIDVEGIAHVVNFDMPVQAEDFIHRIGRTARAGADGRATNFVTVGERETVRRVLRLIADQEQKFRGDEEPEKKITYGRRMKRSRGRRGTPTSGRSLF